MKLPRNQMLLIETNADSSAADKVLILSWQGTQAARPETSGEQGYFSH